MKNKRIKLVSLSLIVAGLSAACSWLGFSTAKKAAPDELFYVSKYNSDTKNSTHGFMDKTGKIVVGPFESFDAGGKKYGGEGGKTAFQFKPFIEGLAGICFADETPILPEKAKCGFIDKTGKIVIEPKYNQISYFSEGLAAVSVDSDPYTAKFGYIDRTGKQIIEPKFMSKAAFNDGLAVVSELVGKEIKQGYIDKTGKYVIEPKYTLATSFGDGHAIVENAKKQKVIIDKSGKEGKIIETESAGNTSYYYQDSFHNQFYGSYAIEKYALLPSFSEGLTMLSHYLSKAKPIGFAKTDGELEIKLDPTLVGQIRPFSEGFAPIGWEMKDKDKLAAILGTEATEGIYDWTYVDRKGEAKVKLDDTFQDARPFSEGLAAVKTRPSKGNWGFINMEFKTAIPACFEKVSDFRAGLASVYVVEYANEKPGCEQYFQAIGKEAGNFYEARNVYIDKTGKIIKPQW